ncbi:hypothetical protein [Bacillus andreraoultii]|uniref:hypothetical protein n=1 Tax=Bacillus andreraoultii TaxID=1499685 RepID=UPI00053A2A7E|nr:hypothetical protein [Bacillus andreraoultii]
MLENLKKYFTLERRLVYSVTVGWSLILLTIIMLFLSSYYSIFENLATFLFLLTPIYLCIRYSTFGPVLKTTTAGFTIVAGVSILDYIFSRRGTKGNMTIGALFGVIPAIFFILIWNTLKALYYLIRETITFFQNKNIILASIKGQSVA